MVKILGRSGQSLGATYDAVGSQVTVDELKDADGINLVDELGSRTHSERLNTSLLSVSSGAIASDTTFQIDIDPSDGIADCPNRLLAINLISLAGNELAIATVFVVDPLSGREIAIWAFDLAATDAGTDYTIRWKNDGQAVTTEHLMVPGWELAPQMLSRIGLSGPAGTMPRLTLRGITAIGAGDTFFFLVQLMRPATVAPDPGEPMSHGLPIPSW